MKGRFIVEGWKKVNGFWGEGFNKRRLKLKDKGEFQGKVMGKEYHREQFILPRVLEERRTGLWRHKQEEREKRNKIGGKRQQEGIKGNRRMKRDHSRELWH